jgi:hypothetical protein
VPVSKRHGAKRKHRKKAAKHSKAVLCASCRQPVALDPAGLLASLAASMNALEEAGIRVGLHGVLQSVVTRKGFVLQLSDRTWAARTRDYEPFSFVSGDGTAGDDMDS